MDGAAMSERASDWERAWPAPAKLNLFLHIVGRRVDGYHLLQTVFRLIDCCDWLRFRESPGPRVSLAQPLPGVAEADDLCVRAARLLQHETGSQRGAEISIVKNIPMGGGLGGGSSDAATTLIALNRLWNLGLSRRRLAELGLSLGADVPFFLFGLNAFGEGVGERLKPMNLAPAWYVVLVPPVSVPTREIFAVPELTRDTKSIKISSFSAGFGRNDLEPVVCSRYPAVGTHLAWLKAYGDARMTGSGACVFAEFSTERRARAVVSGLPSEMRGFAVCGLERHPLAADLV